MTNITNRVFKQFKTTATQLGLPLTDGTSSKLFNRARSSIVGGRNYTTRKVVTHVADKPYVNEFGEQEALSSIADRNFDYAWDSVQRNKDRFEGGVNNMTECQQYLTSILRNKI